MADRRPYRSFVPGYQVGRLRLLERLKDQRGNRYWLARCECGHFKRVAQQNLSSGAITDCTSLYRGEWIHCPLRRRTY